MNGRFFKHNCAVISTRSIFYFFTNFALFENSKKGLVSVRVYKLLLLKVVYEIISMLFLYLNFLLLLLCIIFN